MWGKDGPPSLAGSQPEQPSDGLSRNCDFQSQKDSTGFQPVSLENQVLGVIGWAGCPSD